MKNQEEHAHSCTYKAEMRASMKLTGDQKKKNRCTFKFFELTPEKTSPKSPPFNFSKIVKETASPGLSKMVSPAIGSPTFSPSQGVESAIFLPSAVKKKKKYLKNDELELSFFKFAPLLSYYYC